MKLVEVGLGGPTAYEDYPPIPERFSREFKLWIFDADGGKGMKVHDRVLNEGERDVVSEAIGLYGVWEVPETIILSSAFAAAPEDTMFVDIGSHVGWFSVLAGSYGLKVTAVDANVDALDLLRRSWEDNRFLNYLGLVSVEITEGTHWVQPRTENMIVKMDVEGAERHAVAMLRPWFEDGTIAQCLMEVSPCFNDTYPALLGELFDLGYVGHVMPRKRNAPRLVGDVRTYIAVHCRRLDVLTREAMAEWISRQHQCNVIIFRPEAAWG